MGYWLFVVGCLLLVVRHLTMNDADDLPPQARSVDIDLYIIGDNSPQLQLNFAIFFPPPPDTPSATPSVTSATPSVTSVAPQA
jgi:hypothetical protein